MNKKENNEKKLVLIDTSALAYRAFFAYPSELKSKLGVPTNAIFGFFVMLLKIIEENKPTNIILAFESRTKLKRSEIFEGYKANRKKTDENLILQINLLQEILESLNIICLSKDGYEADDVIGSISSKFLNDFDQLLIITGDRDLLQLINNKTKVALPGISFARLNIYDEILFQDKYEIPVDKYVFYKSLVGDSSDNIKGLAGVGPKTAIKIVNLFSDFNAMLNNLDLLDEKLAEKISNSKDSLEVDNLLSKIVLDLEFDIDIQETEVRKINLTKFYSVFEELNFSSLIKKLDKLKDIFRKEYNINFNDEYPLNLFSSSKNSNNTTSYLQKGLKYRIVDKIDI